MPNTKIQRVKLSGSSTVYDIDLPSDATPSISTLSVSDRTYGIIDAKEITYSALRTLKDNGTLEPGRWYRITDYQFVSDSSSYTNAGHQFDILTKALTSNALCEECFAILHEGDTYFNAENLKKWRLWYTVDNILATANEPAGYKGCIYRMIDHRGNDFPYDFKNRLRYGAYTLNYYDSVNSVNIDASESLSYANCCDNRYIIYNRHNKAAGYWGWFTPQDIILTRYLTATRPGENVRVISNNVIYDSKSDGSKVVVSLFSKGRIVNNLIDFGSNKYFGYESYSVQLIGNSSTISSASDLSNQANYWGDISNNIFKGMTMIRKRSQNNTAAYEIKDNVIGESATVYFGINGSVTKTEFHGKFGANISGSGISDIGYIYEGYIASSYFGERSEVRLPKETSGNYKTFVGGMNQCYIGSGSTVFFMNGSRSTSQSYYYTFNDIFIGKQCHVSELYPCTRVKIGDRSRNIKIGSSIYYVDTSNPLSLDPYVSNLTCSHITIGPLCDNVEITCACQFIKIGTGCKLLHLMPDDQSSYMIANIEVEDFLGGKSYDSYMEYIKVPPLRSNRIQDGCLKLKKYKLNSNQSSDIEYTLLMPSMFGITEVDCQYDHCKYTITNLSSNSFTARVYLTGEWEDPQTGSPTSYSTYSDIAPGQTKTLELSTSEETSWSLLFEVSGSDKFFGFYIYPEW